ncbi:MAG: glycosidase [Planctomycetota bacterium]
MEPIFTRCEQNPIVRVRDIPGQAEAVLNPGATEQDGTVVLLLRVEDTSGHSSIYVARSDNGVDQWRIEPEPLLKYGQPDMRYEQWGCEDPRIVWLDEEEAWYITYTAFSPAGAAVGVARSKDLARAERMGLIFSPNNKDASIFPERIDGRWAALHRPDAGGGIENIWIAYSRDLAYWGEPHCVLTEGRGPAWDAQRVGAGPPPVATADGWLLLYHGVKQYGAKDVYRVGAAMLDRHQPHKLVARTPHCIFKPTERYEVSGLLSNVVFPTGMLLRGDEVWMYYGAGDTCVALATAKLDDVLKTLQPVD